MATPDDKDEDERDPGFDEEPDGSEERESDNGEDGTVYTEADGEEADIYAEPEGGGDADAFVEPEDEPPPRAPAPKEFPDGWICRYDYEGVIRLPIDELGRVAEWIGDPVVTWVHVRGLHREDIFDKLGEVFHIHALALEDVETSRQRAKVEDYENGYFVVARRLVRRKKIAARQVSLFIGPNFIVTHVDTPDPLFTAVAEKLQTGAERARRSGADYLAYLILDSIIDDYYPVLDDMDDVLEKLDSKIIAKPNDKTFARIHRLQRDLLVIRRHAWPMKEVVYALMRDEKNLISKETELHLRDCHDHITQIIDRVEAYREVAANLVHAYEFAVNRQTNEVMRILMIFSTIFLPLTFIVGIYGMNFNTAVSPLNMPELNWAFGYPFAILLMVGTVGGMLLWFRKRAWIEYPWERRAAPPPRSRGVAASAPKKPPRPPRSA